MTAYTEVEIHCDGKPGAGPFDCSSAPVYERTATAARTTARRQGWTTARREGRLVDLCPDHAAPSAAGVTTDGEEQP